jgi:GNAT superfamily N-acetyltransferase
MLLIRGAQEKDLCAIQMLYSQLHKDDVEATDGSDVAVMQEIVSSDRFLLLVGIENDRTIATCYLNIIPNLTRGAAPYGIIENVVTDSEFRNLGHGKAMMQYALHQAWQRGCYKVMLQTGSRKASTHGFYKSCGFSGDDKFAFVARPEG